jgi:hypothetical protein
MKLFDRFLKGDAVQSAEPVDAPLRKALVDLVLASLRDKAGRIRVEDALSAAATIVAERCIDAAGDFPLRTHDLTPGSRVFSTKANELICGDVTDTDLSLLPKQSIVGMLRHRLDPALFADTDFPPLSEVFKQYAARIGAASDGGKVPLSVPQDNLPFVQPLRVGYETRPRVDQILQPIREDKTRCLRIAVESLAEILKMTASAIDHKLALMLTIETINGMSKTAPMTEKAMQQA